MFVYACTDWSDVDDRAGSIKAMKRLAAFFLTQYLLSPRCVCVCERVCIYSISFLDFLLLLLPLSLVRGLLTCCFPPPFLIS